jgi:CSLREA domain-containing protein
MKNRLTAVRFFSPMFAVLLLMAFTAQAATYTVNTTSDSGNGTCDAAECTLREAINEANATTADDVINFDSTVFSIPQIITLMQGELRIGVFRANVGKLTINGTGATMLTISGNNASHVFLNTDFAVTEINGLTVSNGNNSGIRTNTGNLTLNNLTISNNTTSASGGGIFNASGLIINNSTISNNSAGQGGGGIYHNNSVATIGLSHKKLSIFNVIIKLSKSSLKFSNWAFLF